MRNWFSSSSPHRADAAVAQVIDVVDRAQTFAELQQVLDGAAEVFGIEGALVEAGGVGFIVQLDVELHAAHARKIVLARVEEHALEQLGGGVERRRVAGPQLAVNFDQAFVLRFDRVLADGGGNHRAHVIAFGEEDFEIVDAGFEQLGECRGRQLAVGVDQDFTRGHVDHVGHDVGAFQIVGGDFHPLDFVFLDFLVQAGRHLLALGHYGLTGLGGDGVGELQAGQVLVDVPENLLFFDADLADAVERPQNLLVGLVAQRAQENRTVELALTVDAHVEDVFEVVFELDPTAAIRDDLSEEVALRGNAFEEHARRTVQLRDDDAFGAVDDERTVVRHQRNFAEEDFLFLDVADAFFCPFPGLWSTPSTLW